ncbi:DMT family transporter [Gordonia sp. VNK1]|uniref:DMT family transporter n=1 Tax=Gordonia oleivorans TaxID=3156618 RepID=UPI0032B4E062
MVIGIVAAIVAACAYGTASVLQAKGATSVPDDTNGRAGNGGGAPSLRSTIAAMLTATFIAGLVLDGLGFLGNLFAARTAPLFLVQPIIAANLAVTAVLASIVLHIDLRMRDRWAIVAVVVALVVLGVSAGEEGHDNTESGHWMVLGIGLGLLVAGLIGMRLLTGRVAVMAGLLGGTLFGVMAVAVRLVDGLDPFDLPTLLTDPAAYAVVACGLGGFYLFTIALQTGSVSAAAASIVVGETVIPSAVGILWLGDTVRSGWGPIAVTAFVVAVAGAMVVATSSAVTEVEQAENA